MPVTAAVVIVIIDQIWFCAVYIFKNILIKPVTEQMRVSLVSVSAFNLVEIKIYYRKIWYISQMRFNYYLYQSQLQPAVPRAHDTMARLRRERFLIVLDIILLFYLRLFNPSTSAVSCSVKNISGKTKNSARRSQIQLDVIRLYNINIFSILSNILI